MADVTWSAYALAMFTPEQRAAAVQATYEPPDSLTPIPPPAPPSGGLGYLLQVGGRLLDPNKPNEQAEIFAAGWRFMGGSWVAPGAGGRVRTSDELYESGDPGGRPPGVSSVAPLSFIPGGSVLGSQVPLAPPVLLPSFVGGRMGTVRLGGGMRPESGGTPKRVVFGPGSSVLPQVRMGTKNWGR